MKSYIWQHVFLLLFFKADGQSGGCAPSYTWHFLDIRCSCCQHAFFSIPVYFCCFQLITSKFFTTEALLFCWSFTLSSLPKQCLSPFPTGVLCLLISLSSQLRGLLMYKNYSEYVFLWENMTTPNNQNYFRLHLFWNPNLKKKVDSMSTSI